MNTGFPKKLDLDPLIKTKDRMKRRKDYVVYPESGVYEVVSNYKDKSGLRVIVFKQLKKPLGISTPFYNFRLQVYKFGLGYGFLESGWPGEEHEIYEYIRCIELIFPWSSLWTKLQKRRLLRIIRKFPLHPETTYGDFLYQDGRINWDKVEEYETNYKQD